MDQLQPMRTALRPRSKVLRRSASTFKRSGMPLMAASSRRMVAADQSTRCASTWLKGMPCNAFQ